MHRWFLMHTPVFLVNIHLGTAVAVCLIFYAPVFLKRKLLKNLEESNYYCRISTYIILEASWFGVQPPLKGDLL